MLKKCMLPVLMAGMVLLGSCGKEEGKVDRPEGNAALLSYGFYKEDNVSLKEDYTAEIAGEMIVRLPEEVDKTALVARFTAAGDNKVFVGNTEQVSGVTANDFSYPVDYTVRDMSTGKSVTYTVKIGKILKKKWTEAAVYSEGGCVNDAYAMCLAGKDETPHFFFLRERREGDRTVTAGVVASYKDGTVSSGKEITFLADGKTLDDARYPDITADADGEVFVSYYNYVSSTDFSIYVRKSDGTLVGEPFGKTKLNYYNQLEIDPETKVMINASYANSESAPIMRRGINIAYNKSGSWSSENTIADFGTNEVHKVSLCRAGGSVYMGGQLAGKGKPHSYFVYKYDGRNWLKVINALPEGMSAVAQLIPSPIAVASDGTCYMLAGNDSATHGKWFMTLMKCVPGAAKWENVGSMIVDNASGAETNRYSEYDLALCGDKPVIVYLNQDNADNRYPCVLTYNDETRDWNEAVKISSSGVERGSLNIEFDRNGIGYIGYIDNTENKTFHLYKYDVEQDAMR